MRKDFASLITRSGKSMTQVARESGVTLSYVSKLRSGRSTPSAMTIVSLSMALDVPVLDVMRAFDLIPPAALPAHAPRRKAA